MNILLAPSLGLVPAGKLYHLTVQDSVVLRGGGSSRRAILASSPAVWGSVFLDPMSSAA